MPNFKSFMLLFRLPFHYFSVFPSNLSDQFTINSTTAKLDALKSFRDYEVTDDITIVVKAVQSSGNQEPAFVSVKLKLKGEIFGYIFLFYGLQLLRSSRYLNQG